MAVPSIEYQVQSSGTQTSSAWWAATKDEVHLGVFAAYDALRKQQSWRSDLNYRNAKLYGGLQANGYRAGWANPTLSAADILGTARVPLASNLIKSIADTILARLCKSKPRPTFLTTKGDWNERERARNLDTFLTGQFWATGLYEKAVDVLRFGCVIGTGVAKVFPDEEAGCIEVEVVNPDEILVDEMDGLYGSPRNMLQIKMVPRETLLGREELQTKKMQEAIRTAAPSRYGSIYYGAADVVDVVEAWHLPSGSIKGRHVIAISNATLKDEEWAINGFPFAFFRYSKRLMGFWGEGIPERQAGRQLELNKLTKRIQDIIHLCSVPRYVVEDTSKVAVESIRNAIGDVVKYKGTPPTLQVFNAVPPELFRRMEQVVREAYEEEGVSQLSARGTKPAGLDSGAALREFNDIESERFLEKGQEYERFFMRCGELFISIAKMLDEKMRAGGKKNGYSIRAPGKRGIEHLNWKDVELGDDKYIQQAFPTSSLPASPAGRLAQIQELLAAQLITPIDARKLLDYPDLQQNESVEFAGQQDIEATLQRMLDGGDLEPPEPQQDIQYGLKRFQSAYVRLRVDGGSEALKAKLLDWMQLAHDMLNPPPPGPEMGGPPPPPGADVPPEMMEAPPPGGETMPPPEAQAGPEMAGPPTTPIPPVAAPQ